MEINFHDIEVKQRCHLTFLLYYIKVLQKYEEWFLFELKSFLYSQDTRFYIFSQGPN